MDDKTSLKCHPMRELGVNFLIICNEEMKGNAKCKNSRFEPPLGGLSGNVHVSSVARWKARCRLPISDN